MSTRARRARTWRGRSRGSPCRSCSCARQAERRCCRRGSSTRTGPRPGRGPRSCGGSAGPPSPGLRRSGRRRCRPGRPRAAEARSPSSSRTDFPVPEGPRTAEVLPRGTSKVTSCEDRVVAEALGDSLDRDHGVSRRSCLARVVLCTGTSNDWSDHHSHSPSSETILSLPRSRRARRLSCHIRSRWDRPPWCGAWTLADLYPDGWRPTGPWMVEMRHERGLKRCSDEIARRSRVDDSERRGIRSTDQKPSATTNGTPKRVASRGAKRLESVQLSER